MEGALASFARRSSFTPEPQRGVALVRNSPGTFRQQLEDVAMDVILHDERVTRVRGTKRLRNELRLGPGKAQLHAALHDFGSGRTQHDRRARNWERHARGPRTGLARAHKLPEGGDDGVGMTALPRLAVAHQHLPSERPEIRHQLRVTAELHLKGLDALRTIAMGANLERVRPP